MPTPTERRIIEERRAQRRGGILVPILEELHERQVEIEDTLDIGFMEMLFKARMRPREQGVFSPSMLGSCLRQAYFAKRGTEKHTVASPQMNGYFNKGNFVHYQWQFATWKAARAGLLAIPSYFDPYFGDDRPAVEWRVVDKDADEGGTVDVIVWIDGKLYIVDYKGIHLIEWQRTVKKGASPAYRKQIVGYAKLVQKTMGLDIAGCLLISECKAGPVSGVPSPLALHETFVAIEDFEGEVRRRMRTLQWFDDRNETPPPECVSTAHMGYQECPFNRFCRDEVRAIQKEREARARKAAKDRRVPRNSW